MGHSVPLRCLKCTGCPTASLLIYPCCLFACLGQTWKALTLGMFLWCLITESKSGWRKFCVCFSWCSSHSYRKQEWSINCGEKLKFSLTFGKPALFSTSRLLQFGWTLFITHVCHEWSWLVRLRSNVSVRPCPKWKEERYVIREQRPQWSMTMILFPPNQGQSHRIQILEDK